MALLWRLSRSSSGIVVVKHGIGSFVIALVELTYCKSINRLSGFDHTDCQILTPPVTLP